MPQALKGAAEGIRFVDRINRIYRIRSGPRFGWGRARRRRQEQRIGREGYAAASRRMPPHHGEKGQLVFCLAQRRREVFGRGGWTRLTRRKELFSRKERKGRKFFKNRDAPSPERAAEGACFLDRINRIYRIDRGANAGGRASPRVVNREAAPQLENKNQKCLPSATKCGISHLTGYYKDH